jgi:hypothetical protein
MKLVFVHGPAAVGKYTVGRELAVLTGCEFYHNHLVVDEVLKYHTFGTPGFIEHRDRLWREHFEKALREKKTGLIFTFNPENTVPQAFLDWLFDSCQRAGVPLVSVELTASERAIETRLATTQRQQFKKLTDLALYRRLRDSGAFLSPVVPRTDLRIDTEKNGPKEAARLISSLLKS